jgi:fatty acid desaturase
MWYLAMKNSADVRTICIVTFKLVLLAVCWQLYPVLPTVGLVVTVFAQFIAGFCVATMVHNAMHCDVFSNQLVEFVWRIFLAGTFGFPVEAYKPTHNMNHHVFTQRVEDHLHTTQMTHKWHFLNLIMFFPTVYPGIATLENQYLAKECQTMSFSLFSFLVQVIAAHGFTLFLLFCDWRRGLICWFLPNILGVDAIITMNMLQHDGCETVELGKHKGNEMSIDCARNFVGPVINWITCNNGYHTIHHMYSNMHWTQYPEMHEKIVVPRIDPSLNERCIVRYLIKTFFWPGRLPVYRGGVEKVGKAE